MLNVSAISLSSDRFLSSTTRLILKDPQVSLSLTNGFSVFLNISIVTEISFLFLISLRGKISLFLAIDVIFSIFCFMIFGGYQIISLLCIEFLPYRIYDLHSLLLFIGVRRFNKEMFAQNTYSHVFQLVLRLLIVLFGKLHYQISSNLCNTSY